MNNKSYSSYDLRFAITSQYLARLDWLLSRGVSISYDNSTSYLLTHALDVYHSQIAKETTIGMEDESVRNSVNKNLREKFEKIFNLLISHGAGVCEKSNSSSHDTLIHNNPLYSFVVINRLDNENEIQEIKWALDLMVDIGFDPRMANQVIEMEEKWKPWNKKVIFIKDLFKQYSSIYMKKYILDNVDTKNKENNKKGFKI